MASTGIFNRLIQIVETCDNSQHSRVIRKIIPRPRTFIAGCLELDALVGLRSTKIKLVERVQVMLVRGILAASKGHCVSAFSMTEMLHAVFDGPPGVGKSRVSRIVAKILYGLGLDLRCTSASVILPTTPASPAKTLSETSAGELQAQGEGIINTANNLCQYLLQLQVYKDIKSLNSPLNTPRSSPVPSRTKPPTSPKPHPMWKKCQEELQRLTSATSQLNSKIHDLVDLDVIPEDASSEIIDDPEIPESKYLVVAGRQELIASYLGQTAIQVSDFLKQHVGKVIILEEAYTLYANDRDAFGMEALTVLCRVMDEFPHMHTFFFNGYTSQLQDTIFTAQPGLRRRISQTYSCSSYTPLELSQILGQQLSKLQLDYDCNLLANFMMMHVAKFPHYAGDTYKLAAAIETTLYSLALDDVVRGTDLKLRITLDILNQALSRYLDTCFQTFESAVNLSMYI